MEVDPAVLEEAPILDRHDRLLHHVRDLVGPDDPPVLRTAQDGEYASVASVDVAVLDAVVAGRVERRDLACERGDQPVGERRRREDEQDEEQDEEAKLADPPSAPLRFLRTSTTEQSRTIVTLDSPAHGHCRAHPERSGRSPEGRARAKARARPPAPRQARHRRHFARHPRRSRHSAPTHARVPGRGPRRRSDRRRLHDTNRRPLGALGGAACPLRRGDRQQREDLSRPGDDHPRPGPHRGALQRRVALEAQLRGGRPPRAHDYGRSYARARRLRETDGGAGADLGLRAPLPADAGLRLGRGRGRRRARRHRPALQPSRRPGGDGGTTASSLRSCSRHRSCSPGTARRCRRRSGTTSR